jgi:N-acetylglucosaminyldiphosphoundecaprenol N-acetyl-beta-D-mannosaminyltransferase
MEDTSTESRYGGHDTRWPAPRQGRANVLGVGVHAINMDIAVRVIDAAIANGQKGYVCVTGVHGVMESQTDPTFRKILHTALLVTPDGMPTVWVGKLQGYSRMDRVYGPDLMLEVCKTSVERGYSHFLYGGDVGVANALAARMCELYPGIRIVGTFTPPFRPLTPGEASELIAMVNSVKPNIFWVGISTPKQERFMAEYINELDTNVMLGVGAAFDIHTGRTKDAPSWMKRAGLQWLHRLWQEPRRLGKRYLRNNPRFLYKISLQLLGLKRYALDLE